MNFTVKDKKTLNNLKIFIFIMVTGYFLQGRAMTEAVSRRLPTSKAGICPGSVHVRFLVN